MNFLHQLIARYHSASVFPTFRCHPVSKAVSLVWQELCYSFISVDSERNGKPLAHKAGLPGNVGIITPSAFFPEGHSADLPVKGGPYEKGIFNKNGKSRAFIP